MRQGQSLVMTPQLLQAIKLLQFSSLELSNYVEAELERNPLLERAEEPDGPDRALEPGGDGGSEGGAEPGSGPDDGPREGDWLATDMGAERSTIEDRMDAGLDNVFPEDRAPTPAERRVRVRSWRRRRTPESLPSRPTIIRQPPSLPRILR